jgi:uncharacterized linocin/CFP29 family protein
MNHLLRELAPVSDHGWELIEEEARQHLVVSLAARKLVDFSGPHGWERSATNLGRTEPLPGGAPADGVEATRRRVLPLVEPRAWFSLSRAELEAGDRGAEDVDLDALGDAARSVALAENSAVFNGWEAAGITGIVQASPHDAVPLTDDMNACPRQVAEAVEVLMRNGVEGPYGLALDPTVYRRVIETTEHGGYPLFDHLRKITGGPLVWAPGVKGGVVVSLRGGDFLFECGHDLAVGYHAHDADSVHLYLVETFSFRVATPEAAVALPSS